MSKLKFCEKEDFSFLPLPNCMVYFLLQGEEVVYVGQTTTGVVRPLSHKDKQFDQIKVLFVDKDDLDEAEGYFIAKYKPKYNTKLTGHFRLLTARDKIREKAGDHSFTVRDLRKKCQTIGIDIVSINGLSYITGRDIDMIVADMKEDE